MAALEHGILFLDLRSIPHTLIGFYFRPRDGPVKCLLLDPTLDPLKRTQPLAPILESSLYTQIQYRELRRPADANRLKFALINMQSSFDERDLQQAIFHQSIFLNYVIKAVGQNPAERLSQCEGLCYRGPIPNIESYDPFGPKQIYHRDLPAPTLEDNTHLSDLARYLERLRNLSHDPGPMSPGPSLGISSPSTVSIPVDTLFRTFLIQAIESGTAAGDPHPTPLPLSYRIGGAPDGIDRATYLRLRWGLHLYHAGCWEMALTLFNDSHNGLLDEIRATRKTTQWGSIIGNNINSPRGHQYPSAVSLDQSGCVERTIVYPSDPVGLASTVISNYSNFNPETWAPERWSPTSIRWSDWNPLLGPNVWFYLLAPGFRNQDQGALIRTLDHLIDPFVGGCLHGPLNRHTSRWTFWTQDNLVLYAALNQSRAESQSRIDPKFKTLLLGFFGQCLDRENFLFFGRHYWEGPTFKRVLDGSYSDGRRLLASAETVRMPPLSNSVWVISVLDQIWAICALGPAGLDQIFGVPQAGLRMWAHLRASCGRFSPGGELQGFGYTNVRADFDPGMGSVISAEATFGAMIAARLLQNYYPDRMEHTLEADLRQMETYVYAPGNLLGLEAEAASFKEATIRAETGLGEIVHPIPSILGVAWHLFYHHQFNPLGVRTQFQIIETGRANSN